MYIHAHDTAASVSTIVVRCLVQSPLGTGPVEGSIKDEISVSRMISQLLQSPLLFMMQALVDVVLWGHQTHFLFR